MGKRIGALCLALGLMLTAGAALGESATLDLSAQTFTGVEELVQAVGTAEEVALGSMEMTWAQRKSLIQQCPQVHFTWTAQIYGVPVSSEDTAIDLDGVKKLGKITELCDALDCMPQVENVYMWSHGMKRDDKITLHERHPDVFFGWTLKLNEAHQLRTDATAFSTLGKQPLLTKQHMVNITFCPNLLALDVGHCLIQDISFLRDCAKLKVLILADAGIKDLSPLESQTELEYLELFLNDIKDISPLANMTKLRDVNLAFNEIKDLSPLYDLPNLERVWLMQNEGLKQEEVDRLRQHQPDCEIVTYSWGATGNRMKKERGEFIQFPGTSWRDHPHYDTIYYIFNGGEYIGWDDPIPEGWQKKQ